VAEAVNTDQDTLDPALVSPVFGDIPAKAATAARREVERRLRLGLPVIVDRGDGIEDLNARSATR
jgi:hypothetical protein